MINVNKVSEGIHYELIPVEDANNAQAWDIRILEGDYLETVIRFGNVAYNPDDESLHFNFEVVETPDPDVSEDNEDLQDYAAEILQDVLERASASGTLQVKERDEQSTID